MLNFRHPGDVGQSYFQHLLFALIEAIRCIVVGILLIIHAVFPFVFDYIYSNHIRKASERISKFDRKKYETSVSNDNSSS